MEPGEVGEKEGEVEGQNRQTEEGDTVHRAVGTSSNVGETSDEGPATSKRARYACSFHPESNTCDWATVSTKGSSYAYCKLCSRNISVAYGGMKDLRKHEATGVHQSASKNVEGTSSITTYFACKRGPKREEAVVEAEVKFGYFLGEHHLALAVADHCSSLFSSLFPDSAIAKGFKCGRTKATAIVKVIAGELMSHIFTRLVESQLFSLHTDESTDIAVTQQCAIMLRYFDNVEGKVRCIFFKLEPVQRADAECLFQALNDNFSDEGPLTYTNLVGLGSDGCNVMLGSRNSVLTRLKAKQPSLVYFHCNCHVAALIANHACGVLPNYLEDLTVQIWCYFQKSPKRQRTFEEFQAFVHCKPHKLLKAAQTRWLSLEVCVGRLLEQYEALLSYFRSTDDRSATVQRITLSLENPLSKLYLMFLSDALPVINVFNKTMQMQAPTMHFLHRAVQAFMKKILLRFLSPRSVQSSPCHTIDFEDASIYMPLDQVFVGEKARKYLSDESECDLAMSNITTFQDTCKNFWVAAAKYAKKKLPLDSDILSSTSWLLPIVHDYGNLSQVMYLASRLSQVIKEEEKGPLVEEFIDYCASELPPDFERTSSMDIDTYWHKISQILVSDGKICYPLLTKLAKAVLIIPHGNADVERIFSHMGLNKTKVRNSLGVDTLTALLQMQFNVKESCYSFKPTSQMLEKCKNAISSLASTSTD